MRRTGGKRQEQDPGELTPRERLFVLKLVRLENVTAAYLAAGYKCSRVTASVNGQRLLRKARVKEAVDAARARRAVLVEADADESFRLMGINASFDIGVLFDEDGKALPLHELPADARKQIKSIGPDGRIVLYDAARARELLAESGGKIKRKLSVEVEAGEQVLEALERIATERKLTLQAKKET